LNLGPSACQADVEPLHHGPLAKSSCQPCVASSQRQKSISKVWLAFPSSAETKPCMPGR